MCENVEFWAEISEIGSIIESRFVPNARRTCWYIRSVLTSNFTLFNNKCPIFHEKHGNLFVHLIIFMEYYRKMKNVAFPTPLNSFTDIILSFAPHIIASSQRQCWTTADVSNQLLPRKFSSLFFNQSQSQNYVGIYIGNNMEGYIVLWFESRSYICSFLYGFSCDSLFSRFLLSDYFEILKYRNFKRLSDGLLIMYNNNNNSFNYLRSRVAVPLGLNNTDCT